MNKEAAYWIALAHLSRWGNLKINNLIIKFYYENKLSVEDFFQLTESEWENQYGLGKKEVDDLNQAKSELASNAFLAETLHNEGYELIPITSHEYSKTLKENLKASHSPVLLYVKGNKKILREKSIAIVGSRNASDKSLEFTDNIAKIASKEFKVVVSGFAKGVDKQALDSAINYKGQSIIVLPQGIMTFGYGFKKYYKQIVEGDVLVLSTFFPKAPWKAELAMARNPIIYGLADEIYVAESSDKGGTWSGVIDGLRKNRKIFVRKPDLNENNANNLLIQKGAIPVDFMGKELNIIIDAHTTKNNNVIDNKSNDLQSKILAILQKSNELTKKEIIEKLENKISDQKFKNIMDNLENVNIIKNKKPYKYSLIEKKQVTQQSLF